MVGKKLVSQRCYRFNQLLFTNINNYIFHVIGIGILDPMKTPFHILVNIISGRCCNSYLFTFATYLAKINHFIHLYRLRINFLNTSHIIIIWLNCCQL